MSDKVREQFESCAHTRWHPDAKGSERFDRHPNSGYYNTTVEYAWRVWQASRATALEEAADFVERRYLSDVPFHKMRGHLAAAIRALLATPGGDAR